MINLPPIKLKQPIVAPTNIPPGPDDLKATQMRNNPTPPSSPPPGFGGEIRIVKFMMEFTLYPNGAMYHRKTYPIGMPTSHKGKKKAVKKESVALQEAIQEETL